MQCKMQCNAKCNAKCNAMQNAMQNTILMGKNNSKIYIKYIKIDF